MHGSPLRCIGALTLASDFPERCDGGGGVDREQVSLGQAPIRRPV